MSWIKNLFNRPESGKVKLTFIATDENDEPYEDVAIVPYTDGYSPMMIEAKFRTFMRLRKHKVLEVVIVEKYPNTN